MKLTLLLSLFLCHAAQANSIFSVKERLRVHLWLHGLDEKAPPKVKSGAELKPIPEELERALKKI